MVAARFSGTATPLDGERMRYEREVLPRQISPFIMRFSEKGEEPIKNSIFALFPLFLAKICNSNE